MTEQPAGAPPPPRAGGRWHPDPTAVGIIAVIFLTEAAIGILLVGVNPQYPLSHFGGGVRVTGFAFSAYFAAKMIGQPLSGWLADRVHPRLVLVAGVVVCVPVVAEMAATSSVWGYLGSWLLFGLTLAVVWPSMYAIVGQRFRPSLHARLLAIISAAQIGGTAAGAGIGAVLVQNVGYGWAYALAGVMLAAAALAGFSRVQDTPRGGKPAQTAAQRHRGIGIWLSVINLETGTLIVVITAMSAAVALLAPDLKPYSDKVLHLQYAKFVPLLVPPAALAGALLVPSGWLSDRIGRGIPLAAGLLLFALGLLLVGAAHDALTAVIAACVAAIGYVGAVPALNAYLLDLSGPDNRGLLTGVTTSIQALGGVIGPALGGALTSSLGARAPFRFAALLVLLTFLIAVPFAFRTRGLYRSKLRAAP